MRGGLTGISMRLALRKDNCHFLQTTEKSFVKLHLLSTPGFLRAFASLCLGGGLIVKTQISFPFGGTEFVPGLSGGTGYWPRAYSYLR